MDAGGEAPRVVEGLSCTGRQLLEQRSELAVLLPREQLRELEVHTERNELLLQPVMEIPFDRAPLVVVGAHEPSARGTKPVSVIHRPVVEDVEARGEMTAPADGG